MIILVLVALEGLSSMVTTVDAETLRPHASKILSLSESSFKALTSGSCDYCHRRSIEGVQFDQSYF
jgi:hypothetical protein